MDLNISTRSYNTYGGTPEFEIIEALFELSDQSFGTALQKIEICLCFASRPDATPRSSLEGMFKDYHAWLETGPSRTFRRKRAELDISTKAEFAFARDIIPKAKHEYKARNERYIYTRQLEVLALLEAELKASKSKFKASDDFDHAGFIEWVGSLGAQIPKTKAEADALIEKMNARRQKIFDQKSAWQKLDIDWDDYHRDARTLVPDHRLWSIIDDFAPNGNDTGADVLSFVEEDIKALQNASDEGRAFYKQIWIDWDFSWPPNRTPSDEIEYTAHRQLVVGLAFAHLKLLGHCPEWLRVLALEEVTNYKRYIAEQNADWVHLQEAVAMQDLMISVLDGPSETRP